MRAGIANLPEQERDDEDESSLVQKNPVRVVHVVPMAPQMQRSLGLSGT